MLYDGMSDELKVTTGYSLKLLSCEAMLAKENETKESDYSTPSHRP